jgi:hypothetical protein
MREESLVLTQGATSDSNSRRGGGIAKRGVQAAASWPCRQKKNGQTPSRESGRSAENGGLTVIQ